VLSLALMTWQRTRSSPPRAIILTTPEISSGVSLTTQQITSAKMASATHMLGPRLASDPAAALTEGNKQSASSMGISARSEFHVTETLLVLHVDKKASFVASDAKKLVAAFATARAKLKAPELQGVLLLAKEQKLCSRVDKPERARPQLLAANIAVYRLDE
jgi:hypothetical protein